MMEVKLFVKLIMKLKNLFVKNMIKIIKKYKIAIKKQMKMEMK